MPDISPSCGKDDQKGQPENRTCGPCHMGDSVHRFPEYFSNAHQTRILSIFNHRKRITLIYAKIYSKYKSKGIQRMNILKGDLIKLALAGEFDVIIHGCNCFCSMGAGIAKQIMETFPGAYHADKKTVSGDKNKLGTYSKSDILIPQKNLTIVNGYTQYHYAGSKILADYDAIKSLFSLIKTDFPNKTIAYPKIGAGLAGGDWKRICGIIEDQLSGENHTLVEYLGLQK
jgi:O-acetyl-ADP-ribose deacetylase (regulator of RNase III)